MLQGFSLYGEPEVGGDYEDRVRKRRLAEALMQQGADFSPVRSWTQGAARLAQALVGGYESGKYDREQKATDDPVRKALEEYRKSQFGGSTAPAASGAGPAATPTAYAPGEPASLIQSESGGNWQAQNDAVGAGGKVGHFGRLQFGQARLEDAINAGAIPPGTTPQQFMASPELQKAAEKWHFADIDKAIASGPAARAIGSSINGVPVTPEGLRAVAHLGGVEGMNRFVTSGGQYNPADANGTTLMDYFKRHGGAAPQPTQVAQAGGPVASDAPPMAYAGAPAGAALTGALARPTSPPITPPQPTGNVGAALMAAAMGPGVSPGLQRQAMQMYELAQKDNRATYQTDGEGNIIQLDPTGRQPPRVVYKASVKPMTVARGGAIYNPQTGQFVTPPAGPGQQAEVGLNPQYGVDAEGNPVLIQLGKDGKAVQSKLPEGVKLSKEPIRVDAGTEIILLDPITRNPVGRIPKNIAEAARQREVGEAQGQSQAAAPSQLAAADDALSVLDQIKKHKGMDRAIGVMSNFPTVRGSEAYGFESLVDQARSGAFLTAIGQLKGMGALSNAEGQTATAAVTRMNIGQSKADFMKALEDYEKVVKAGREKALRAIQGGSAAPAAPATTTLPGGWSVERVN